MKTRIALASIAFLGFSGLAQAQDLPPDPWGDATVSRAQAEAKAGERFDELDKDKDGSLSEEEMAAGRPAGGRRWGGGNGGPPNGAPREGGAGGPGGPGGPGGGRSRADTNGDGKIDKAEFAAGQLRRFDREDENKDGQLTKDERETARAQMMMRMMGGGGQ